MLVPRPDETRAEWRKHGRRGRFFVDLSIRRQEDRVRILQDAGVISESASTVEQAHGRLEGPWKPGL